MQGYNLFSRIMRFFATIVAVFFISFSASHAEDCVLGTEGCEPEFTITTVRMPSNSVFSFRIYAKGTFYIDWGDGSEIDVINNTAASSKIVRHTYKEHGVYTIGMSGQATGYSSTTLFSTISFSTGSPKSSTYIAKISGSLGAIFGTISQSTNPNLGQPNFGYTFADATKLTGLIPENLFDGIFGRPRTYMFEGTFSGCSGLGTGVNGNDIPDYIRQGYAIPPNLFAGLDGAPAANMFNATFDGCSGLTGSIPENLFAGISGKPASSMFAGTFYGCSGLTGSIPENLFAGISGDPANYMFDSTFYGCSGLTGYVPSELFAGINTTTTATDQMLNVFSSSGLGETCPTNMYVYNSPFSSYFSDKVSCAKCPDDFPKSDDDYNSTLDQCYTSCDSEYSENCKKYYNGEVLMPGEVYTIRYLDSDGNEIKTPNPKSWTIGKGISYRLLSPHNKSDFSYYYVRKNLLTRKKIVSTLSDGVIREYAKDNILNVYMETAPFSVTTTEMSSNTIFEVGIGAEGRFYINWGDGSDVDVITTPAEKLVNIVHKYKNAGRYTIKFSGVASGYNTLLTSVVPAITFKNNKYISGISGSLGAIFPTRGGGTEQPQFYETFRGCTNLKGSIPENLFAGLDGAPASKMFYSTFYGCSGLTGSIPENLFAGLDGAPASEMFYFTFFGCRGLTGSIPENLFAGISGKPAISMFESTFYGCSGLTGSIPENLFAGLDGAPAREMFSGTFFGCSGLTGNIPENLFAGINGAIETGDTAMFSQTFHSCSGLTGNIPENLFGRTLSDGTYAGIYGKPAGSMFYRTFSGCSGLTGNIPENLFGRTLLDGTYSGISGEPASEMFYSTFDGCSGLTGSIPENLFAGISGKPASNMFDRTFYKCSGLTGAIPENLFAGISGKPASSMFAGTFYGCRGLTGYVPSELFAGIDTTTTATDQMLNVFSSSGLGETCPTNMYVYNSPFSSYFSDKVSCAKCPDDFPKSDDDYNSTLDQCYTSCDSEYSENCKKYYNGEVLMPGEVYTIRYLDSDGNEVATLNPKTWTIGESVKFSLVEPLNSQSHAYYYVKDGETHVDVPYISDIFILKYAQDNIVPVYVKTVPFSVTTIEMDENTTFTFNISAAGQYEISWGDGSEIEIISKESVGSESISHIYKKSGKYTIGISGNATLYSTSNTTAAISFSGNKNISRISGSLGAIFGTLTDRVNSDGTLMADAQPRFSSTFYNCTNLKGSIPENLFAGISGAPVSNMFDSTFAGCSGLTGNIPENLFAGISGAPASYMFYSTFNGCSGLTGSIPENLFAGLDGAPASYMFSATFYGCSGLTGNIPENLFAGLDGAPASYMFSATFYGCSGLTGGIPENLFAGINGAIETGDTYMFDSTFYGCSGLTGNIPENLFGRTLLDGTYSGISGEPASNMFDSTFYGCRGLTGNIPENLFSRKLPDGTYAGISGAPASGMFHSTFNGCSGLTGNIPENLFGRTLPDGTYAGISGAPASDMFYATFNGCSGLTGGIPENLFAGINGVIETSDTYMFAYTFSGCSGLTGNIPENLFGRTLQDDTYAGISGAPAGGMFYSTFNGCSGLTGNIPENLFGRTLPDGTYAGISGAPASSMFYSTFNGCKGLTGYIPSTLFKGIMTNTTASYQMGFVVDGTYLDTECPAGTYKYITGFESWFGGRVSCAICPETFPLSNVGDNATIDRCYTKCEPVNGAEIIRHYTADGVGNPASCNNTGNTYTVTYNANGGSGEMSSDTFQSGVVAALSANTFTAPAENMEFRGWSTVAKGLVEYTDEEIVTNLASSGGDVTLYAVWRMIPEFEITVIPHRNSNGVIYYYLYLYAGGTFYIDWGDGSAVQPVNVGRNWNGNYIEHIYPTMGRYTIGISGQATQYLPYDDGDSDKTEIHRRTIEMGKVTKISGSLGKVFGVLSDGSTPSFYGIFNGCGNLTGEIPETLFSDIDVPGREMFYRTFSGCSGLTGSIPENLFSGISGDIKDRMFAGTFENCSNLTGEIPSDLFKTFTGSSVRGFDGTFSGASKLGLKENGESSTIPETLFANISGATTHEIQMFNNTFAYTGYLTSYVPVNLFRGVTGFLDENADGSKTTTYTGGGMTDIFYKSDISLVCPTGMYQYLTGFEIDWNGRVACEQCPSEFPNSDGGDNVTIKKCYATCDALPDGTIPMGKKYWNKNGEGDSSTCNVPNAKVYTIRYMDEDGKEIETELPKSWTIGTTQTFQLTNATRSGYDFHGWYREDVMYQENVVGTKLTEITEEYVINNAVDDVVTIYGQFYLPSVFWMTTTKMLTEEEFRFSIVNVTGEFYVDWGDGNVKKYKNGNLCVHKYLADGVYRIGLSGNATSYPNANNATVGNDCETHHYYTFGVSNCFVHEPEYTTTRHTPNKLAKIEGRLGRVFPTLADGSNPDFAAAFCNTGIKDEIPSELFDGIHGQPVTGMFMGLFMGTGISGEIPEELFSGLTGKYTAGLFDRTFSGCSKLTGNLPDELFVDLSGAPQQCMFNATFQNNSNLEGSIPDAFFNTFDGVPAPYMFRSTFSGCSGLKGSIPGDLFAGVNGVPAIAMYDSTFSGCSGLKGEIPDGLFGTFTGDPAERMFAYTFSGCSGLKGSIPGDLFAGVNGVPAKEMYSSTFSRCSGLTDAIPDGLFGTFTGAPAERMFYSTFSGCSGLKGSIPGDLFAGVKGNPAKYMYDSTFYNCSGLTDAIPDGLFGIFTGAPAESMFSYTFSGCSGLKGSIPGDLFAGVKGNPAQYMYNGTFYNCSGLTGAIPDGLFGTFTGSPAYYMFSDTFYNCRGLGTNISDEDKPEYMKNGYAIPPNLFAGISGVPYQYMFSSTFYNCRGLTGKIPEELFAGIRGNPQYGIYTYTFDGCTNLQSDVPTYLFSGVYGFLADNAAGTKTSGYRANYGYMDGVFYDAGIITQCPSGEYQYLTGLEGDWNGRVACEPCPEEFPYSDVGDNVTIKKCYTDCDECEDKILLGGKKYWTENGEGDISGCICEPDVYNIVYLDEEGQKVTTDLPIKWKIGETESFELTTPVKNGYKFNGWYRENVIELENIVGTRLTEISEEYIVANANYDTVTIYAQFFKEPVFWMTTTHLKGNEEFNFAIANVEGTFYVEWGDGTVTKYQDSNLCSHKFKNPGVYRIGLSGTPTAYLNAGQTIINDDCSSQHAVTFTISKCWQYGLNVTPLKLAKIEGKLGQVFPTLNGQQPDFAGAFCGCINLQEEIPPQLFEGISGQPGKGMFSSLFQYDSGLTGEIKSSMFGNLTGSYTDGIFASTFEGCSGLTGAIPEGLFGDLHNTSKCMFNATFSNAVGLGTNISEGNKPNYITQGYALPTTLFAKISGNPKSYMFSETFNGCAGLEGKIPANLFSGITGQIADSSFNKTFQNCSGLTGEIPENLFAGITGTANGGFYNTFNGATKLGLKEDGSSSPIPSGLFKNISGDANSANQMFNGTFANTGYLTSYVPVDLFKNVSGFLSDNQTGTRTSTYVAGGMTNIFDNSAISTVCPSGMYQYLTGFEVDWSGRVACEQCPEDYPLSDVGDNITINKCYTECEEIPGKTLTGGKKYYNEELTTCVYDGIAYNINYELNGGVNYEGAPTSYVYGIGATIGGTPTKNSFAFISWCRDAELTDCAMPYEIGATDSGDITLYAKWQFICETDKWFHIGEDRMCLYRNKETEKTINFDIGGDVYYLLMSINPDLRINATSTKKLRMQQNGVIYNGHDWSVM